MGISVWQLLIILLIVLLLFGTKKLRNLGADLGASIKSFRQAVREGEPEASAEPKQIEEAPAESAGEGPKAAASGEGAGEEQAAAGDKGRA